jgi:hypothetical protein
MVSPQTGEGGPSETELEARMQPGAFSKAGFLGPGERLADVIESDAETLRSLGLNHVRVADELEALIAAAERSPERRASSGSLECRVEVRQGFQICPWADPGTGRCPVGGGARHASVEWSIANGATGVALRGPGLIVHLIRDHSFFEGPTSPNRVDPAKLAALLGLS